MRQIKQKFRALSYSCALPSSPASGSEKVNEFLQEQTVNYPTAKEDGTLSKHFNVSGIPAAAAVKDGKVIWRGHPGRRVRRRRR